MKLFCRSQILIVLFGVATVCTPLAAHADTLSIFSFNNVIFFSSNSLSPGGGTGEGTISIDTTVGYVYAIDFTFVGNYPAPMLHFTDLLNGGPNIYDDVFIVSTYIPPGDLREFGLTLPGLSLINYAGGDICSAENVSLCNGSASTVFDFSADQGWEAATGNLVFESTIITPEPSTFALFGTGLVLALGAARRRDVPISVQIFEDLLGLCREKQQCDAVCDCQITGIPNRATAMDSLGMS